VDGPYDSFLLKRAIKLLPKDFVRETLIDVGANIGTVSIPAIKDGLFKNGVAFEPNPKIYNILKINIFLNNLNKEIIPLDFCLSSKSNDNLSFNMSTNNYGDTRFKRNGRNNLFPKDKVKKLDSFIKLVNPNKTLIKIDVQGFEPEVLLGSKVFLNFQPPLILEVDPIIINKSNFMIMLGIVKKNYRYFFELNNQNFNKNSISFLEDLFFRLKKSKKLSNILVIK
jgi:FkbM family methyltransferase